MKTLLAGIFFGAAALLSHFGTLWADEPPPSERLTAEGWDILSGNSPFEPFCDRPAQAREKFMRAIQYDSDNASAHRGWGRAVEDLARCPIGVRLAWSDTVRLTDRPKRDEPPVDLPEKVIIDAAHKYRRAAELAPEDLFAWADWGRSLMYLAALEPTPGGCLEMAGLAAEKYEMAEALDPGRADLQLAWARGLLTVLTVEDDPETWPILWERTLERYYRYIDLSPEEAPKSEAAGSAKPGRSGGKSSPPERGEAPAGRRGVSPKLAAWSVFGREVSQAARDFREPDKTRLLLGAVIESMRLLVVAKPDYDLSLDVNSLSRAYLDLMAVTADEELWLTLLSQAGDLADQMIELDHENPVIDFVLWNWRRAAEAEADPFRRSALIARAVTTVETLGIKERQAPRIPPKAARASGGQGNKASGKGKNRTAKPVPPPESAPTDEVRPGSGHSSRFLMVFAALMDPGPRREELLARAERGFVEALAHAEGETAARLRLIQAQELMNLAVRESNPASADALVAQAEEQYRLSLDSTARPGLILITWATDLETAAVAVTPDGGAGIPADVPNDDPGQPNKTTAGIEKRQPVPVEPLIAVLSRREALFEAAVEKYKLAAGLPGGERALEYLGGLYFKRALNETNPVQAEALWLKTLESFRRAANPAEGESFNEEASFRLGQVYATLAVQGPSAASACLKDSGHTCLGAAMRVYREVFAALPEAVNKSLSGGDLVVRPDLSPALSPRIDPTRLGRDLTLVRPPARDATERRRRALTRTAADGFLQILLAVDPTPPPPPPRGSRRNQPPPPPDRRVRLQGPDRALLAALYRMAAGYRQMDPDYKAIYLRRAESL